MAIINRASFIATDSEGNGTVEVTLRNETRRVKARLNEKYGWMYAYEMTGRYQTGGKAWPAMVRSYEDGSETVDFGRDDRNPKFNKMNAIFFA